MKTRIFSWILAIASCHAALPSAALATAASDDKAAHACCCATSRANITDTGAQLSDRSIYQLDATWTDDAGRAVTLASLRGKPVVLAMFFASCEYACPILVNDMQRIRDRLPDSLRADTRFVLVSFDSERDSAGALKIYRERAKLDQSGWTLLRGESADVQELAMLLGVKYRRDARGQYAHSNLITVLNSRGEIVHQRPGLQGEIGGAVAAIQLAAK